MNCLGCTSVHERVSLCIIDPEKAIQQMVKARTGPQGCGGLGRMAIYFQGAGEHW